MQEGICADCNEHTQSCDESDNMSECCGASILSEGSGYDEDYGKDR